MKILKDSKYFKYEQYLYKDITNKIPNGLQLDNFNIYSFAYQNYEKQLLLSGWALPTVFVEPSF